MADYTQQSYPDLHVGATSAGMTSTGSNFGGITSSGIPSAGMTSDGSNFSGTTSYGTASTGTTLNGTTSANGTTSSGGVSAAGLKDSIVGNAQAAADSIANHPTTQSIADGPLAQSAKAEVAKTSDQFSNVAASRKIPDEQTATGQNLTHYHSLFYNILSWENPRVTGIAYAAIIAFIFTTRYVPLLKYFFKFTFIVLGVIAAAEISGKFIFEKGLATQVRPRKYYTIPRESLEAALEDTEQLVNFFVIEFQRIVFAENIYATVTAFSAALIAYFLVKFVPKWGIALIGTTTVFFVPLIYIQNRELIDGQLSNASTIINQQATQVRDLAAQHTGRAGEVAKSTVNQYSAKAQELMGQAKAKTTGTVNETSSQRSETTPLVKKDDFPAAPRTAPVVAPARSEPVATLPTVQPVLAD